MSGHLENRSGERRGNFDGTLGWDRLADEENDFYVGARIGVYREEVLFAIPTREVRSHFLLGTQAYRYFGVAEGTVLRVGAVVDIITQVPNSAVAAYAGVLAGMRFFTQKDFYLEIPVELGSWPAFSGIGVFVKIGIQVGMGF